MKNIFTLTLGLLTLGSVTAIAGNNIRFHYPRQGDFYISADRLTMNQYCRDRGYRRGAEPGGSSASYVSGKYKYFNGRNWEKRGGGAYILAVLECKNNK